MFELDPQEMDPPLGSQVILKEKSVKAVELPSGKEDDLLTGGSDFAVTNVRTDWFRRSFFPNVARKEWNNWRWQIRNSFTNFKKLASVLGLENGGDFEFLLKSRKLPLRITPYYASLLYEKPWNYPLIKAVVPSRQELVISPGEESDPLHEESMCPVPNLVHRYPDRVLFLVTGFCSVYCRYCTRSHMVAKEKKHCGIHSWGPGIDYIRQNSQIRDVVISGGDPLTLPDAHIEFLLKSLRAIPHVEIIRIGTKVPVVLPQRITHNLVRMLRRYHPLYMSIHFTHPDELTPEVSEACNRIADHGIIMGSQTVLLKGINDDVSVMKSLMRGLLKIRVRPYYIYQCDPIPGSSHFRTPVTKGLEIIQGLRGFTSGYAVPHFVIDAPGGGGKIPLLPDYCQGREGDYIVLRNYEGKTYRYYDPL